MFGVVVVYVVSTTLYVILQPRGDRCTFLVSLLTTTLILALVLGSLISPVGAVGRGVGSMNVGNSCFGITLGTLKVKCISDFTSSVYGSTKRASLSDLYRAIKGYKVFLLSLPLVVSIYSVTLKFMG